MSGDGAPIGRAIYDEIVAFVQGPLVHVLAHPDDVDTVRAGLVDVGLRAHVRASWVLNPGQVITIKGSTGALRCPGCPPHAGLAGRAEIAERVPVRTSLWREPDPVADVDDYAAAVKRAIADYPGHDWPSPFGPVTP